MNLASKQPPDFAPGDILTVPIHDLAHDGRGLGFVSPEGAEKPGLLTLVAGALPGQNVECVVDARRSFGLECRLTRVHSSLWQPEPPLCPWQDQCGGCPLMPMPYELQLQVKEKMALDAMSRIGGIDRQSLLRASEKTLPSPLLTAYRNKAVFAFGLDKKGGLLLGFRKPFSHDICGINSCAMLDPSACEIMVVFRTMAAKSGIPQQSHKPGFWRFLSMRKGRSGKSLQEKWWLICLTGKGTKRERRIIADLGRELIRIRPDIACFIHEERYKNDFQAIGQKRIASIVSADADENPRLALGGRSFSVDAASFFQINSQSAEMLAKIVMELARNNIARDTTLLDLYCGSGAPGQLIANNCRELIGIELDARAAAMARRNAAEAPNLDNCVYLAGDVADCLSSGRLAHMKNKLAILADPPRAGIGRKAMESIMPLAPEHIIYVSCNPATMARDAAFLRTQYQLTKFASVDMFPHTPHLECCALWHKSHG